MVKTLMNIMFLSCKQVTELVEKKQLVGLSTIESMRFRLHVVMCAACKSYERQSLLIEQALKRMIQVSRSDKDAAQLHPDTKLKILEKIKTSK
ncbi:hypothetical protein [Spongiimicrobium sp. 2-473A-2-J]|uniref:hypothetical protein n=1 Tax=Eudoraea algarum TaxID=3417568 RepID=UPI003D36AA96